jgi:hypothetical protein
MAWGPEKCAGFALAALLSDDRELNLAGPALEPAQRAELARQLAHAGARRAEAIADWLALLRPELGESALALPPRARALLAPQAKPELRRALLASRPPARAHFAPDRPLLDALLRIARWHARSSPTPPHPDVDVNVNVDG